MRRRPFLLAALATALLFAAPAQAAPTTIATWGQGAGRVDNPTGTAVDPNPASSSYRDLYVADRNNFRVDKFGPSGEFLLAWGFGVADGKSRELQVCGPPPAGPPPGRCFHASANTARASGAVAPSSLAVEPTTGDVFASDTGNARISKYTPQGQFLLAFGGGVASGGAKGTGDIEAGSKRVEGVTLTKKVFLTGQILTAPGGAIPPGTEITSVNSSGRLELSKPATETATGVTLSAAEDPGNVPTDERQLISLDPAATSGNFKLSFAPPIGAAQTTANIPYNATPGDVQSALALLPAIGAGNVIVGSANPGGGPEAGGPYEVEFTGGRYADTDVAQLKVEPGSPNLNYSAASEVQTTRQGALAAEVCTTDCVGGQLAALPGVFAESSYSAQGSSPGAIAFDPAGDLRVLSGGRAQRFAPDGSFLSEVAIPADSQVRGLAIDPDPTSEDLYVLGPRGRNATQTVNAKFITEGTYTLSFEGKTTEPLPGAASSEAIQAALEGLSTIGPGNVRVTRPNKEPLAYPATVTFVGDLGGRPVPPLSASGGSPPVTVTEGAEGEGVPGSVRRLDGTDGHLIKPLDDEEGDLPAALLTDSVGNLYVGDAGVPYHFLRFDSSGVLSSAFAAGQVLGEPGTGLSRNALALDEASGTLYSATLSGISGTESAVQAFPLPEPGPLPEGLEATEVLPSSATLAVTLNPEGSLTHYRFQYLTRAEYEAHGFAECGAPANPGCAETPSRTLPEGSPPPEAGYEAEAISAEVEALIPATEYRLRLLAENEAGEVEPEATFTTRPAVGIEAQWASEVAAASASLQAEIDPLGPEAQWWIEYGTTDSYGSETAKAHLPAGFGEVRVGEALTGLQPSTTYHYRFAAEDTREKVKYTAHGEDRTFTTQLAALGFQLPDNRAWEMVTPSQKYGGRVAAPFDGEGLIQAAANGEALAFNTAGSIEAEPQGNRAPEDSSALARRGAGGAWSARDITPPHTTATFYPPGHGREYKLFSTDLESALLEPRDFTPLSPWATERTPYLRADTEPAAYTPLLSGAEGYADVSPGAEFGGDPQDPIGPVAIAGASPDLAHVALRSRGVALAEGASGKGLYLWSGAKPPAQRLSPASVLPEAEGEEIVSAQLGSGSASVRGAVSANGSRVFWSSGVAAPFSGLYVRDSARGETARLDEVQAGAFGTGEVAPLFQGASADGAVAFFTDTQNLTADANEEGADLYRCAVVVKEGKLACELTDLTAQTENFGEAAAVQGLMAGIGKDGSRAYFVARGALAAANSEGASPAPGDPNLYLWRQGEGIRFAATLSEFDFHDWAQTELGAAQVYGYKSTATASPSGRYLAFMSQSSLTGYDNRDARSGEADQEVFRYDAEADGGQGKLICASCNPAGQRPEGRAGAEYGREVEFDPQELWSGVWVAAVLPEATRLEDAGASLYRPRAVQDDGRLYFNAADSLVGGDSNGSGDVYQYEPEGVGDCGPAAASPATALLPGGCVSLLSSGAAGGTSAFIDASEGGDNVFFYSPGQLSVTDEDQVTDIYDARTGGEPARREEIAECQGEACQPPAVPPASATPASASFRGPGNLKEKSAAASRCTAPARRAQKLSHRAKRARRHARQIARNPAKRGAARRLHRKAARLAHRAQSDEQASQALPPPRPRRPKEPSMRRSAPTLAILFALAALAAPTPAAAAQPWWQVLSGSRPSNLPQADPAEVQEVKASESSFELYGFEFEALVARIELGGETVGCLGSGEFLFESADQLCETLTGHPAIETAAELREALEAPALYNGPVTVEGPEDVGQAPYTITTDGRWVRGGLQVSPVIDEVDEGGERPAHYTLGSASAQITSVGSGILTLTLTNLGDAPADGAASPVAIEDTLPTGVSAYAAKGIAGVHGGAGAVSCDVQSTSFLRCSFKSKLPSYEAIEVEVKVALNGAPAGAGTIAVSGGGGAPKSEPQPINASEDPVPFGLERFAMGAEEEGGAPTAQAGAHPFQLTNTVQFLSGPQQGSPPEASVAQPALPRNVRIPLPAGLVGSATATPRCDLASFLTSHELANECPPQAALGVASATVIETNTLKFARVAVPVFNLPPQRGEPARFGFMVAGVPILIETSVDPEDAYRVIAEVRNAPQTAQVLSSTVSLWGNPGDPRHDTSRGWQCAYFSHPYGGCPEGGIPAAEDTPFLRMPVSCASPLPYRGEVEPWNQPRGAVVSRAGSEAEAPRGCSRVPFDPHVSNALTSKLAANPSGLDFQLEMPGAGLLNPKDGAISEAQFKRVEVALPKGVTLNPSAAEGLAVCSEAAYKRERYDSAPGVGCPEASKIGSVKVSTPLLQEQAEGALYQAEPYANPTHSLLGLYLIAKIPERGVLVKQAGSVEPDPSTGQLVSSFDGVPQVPISSFKLHFREGGRAPLITPPGCGTFTTTARFVPWSAQDPDNPAPSEVVTRSADFTIEHGVSGGACPSGPAPFNPGFEAGTLNNQAGSYSPFVMHLTRRDGEQDMGKFSFTLPPGVLGKLAGIPYCPEAGIARAQSRQGAHGGTEEIDDPSCPAASQIGTTVGGAGVGNQLTYVKGKLYLAGPWHGDPLSVLAITPAVAGPFDAGTVVVREALRLNPITARAEVDGAASDPIPHILKGIPLNLRDLRVYADRPDFTLNATSCDPFAAESTIWGDGTALEPLAQTPVDLSSRYQAAGCAGLGFKPKLGLKLKGGTRRGAFPALKAVYAPRRHGDANLSRLALTFPNSEFIEQGHFRTICTRVQFAAGNGFGEKCPKGSVYGHVKAWSPLLEEPLTGPVYLRSSNHNLPDAVLALHGLVDIEVATRIDSVHGRLRATVANVPDAPVSHAIVRMAGGQKGLFVNSRNLCVKAKQNRARADAKGQNGRGSLTKPVMRAVKCGKAKRRRHGSHRKRRSHR